MASVSAVVCDFDRALSYALRRLGTSDTVLKPEQKAPIRHMYDGKDVFMLLPTGFGKSVCYKVLPFIFDFRSTGSEQGTSQSERCSLAIVISPLISLVADQVTSLRRRGARSAIVSSGSGVEKELLASEEDIPALLCS